MSIPADLRYTKDHEWTKLESGSSRVTVGITGFAVEQLGDITLVNLDVNEGDELTAGKAFGTIESVKTLSDLYAPVSGKVVAINRDLDAKPELVNDDPYGKGWMIVIESAAADSVANLLDAGAYQALLDASSR
jgi:glycine cleavage system H protein